MLKNNNLALGVLTLISTSLISTNICLASDEQRLRALEDRVLIVEKKIESFEKLGALKKEMWFCTFQCGHRNLIGKLEVADTFFRKDTKASGTGETIKAAWKAALVDCTKILNGDNEAITETVAVRERNGVCEEISMQEACIKQ